MYVKKIDWLDEVSKEAIVEVAEGIERLVCFSCPCLYKLNDMLREPLECLDTQDIVSCSTVGSDIKKLEKKFSYKLKGQVKDKSKGLIDVYGFIIHINEQGIPNDIENGMFVEFITSRIDLWYTTAGLIPYFTASFFSCPEIPRVVMRSPYLFKKMKPLSCCLSANQERASFCSSLGI